MNKPTILIVDDELLIRDLLYDFFTNQGWEITTAENGAKALEILENRSVDLLLTDLKMPGLDGMELTNRVKEEYPSLPVVIMTGFPSIDSAVQALRYKVEDYIIKPFNINQLFKTVERSVKTKS